MMTMDDHWKELKTFLERGILDLQERADATSFLVVERNRLISKKDGMNVALQHMLDTEKIYGVNK